MHYDYLKNQNEIICNYKICFEKYFYNDKSKITNIGIIDYGITEHYYLKDKFNKVIFNNNNNSWHGNAVAGLIGMNVKKNCNIYSYNIYNDKSIKYYNVIDSLYQAINDGMDLINISLGMVINIDTDIGKKIYYEWEKVTYYAKLNKVLIVVSAGNLGLNMDNIYPYKILPAMLDNVITIGSSYKNSIQEYSNFGSQVNEYIFGGNRLLPLITCTNENIIINKYFTDNLKNGFMRIYGTSLSAALFSGLITDY